MADGVILPLAADLAHIAESEVADSAPWGSQHAPAGQVIRVDVDPAKLNKNVVLPLAIHAPCGRRQLLNVALRPVGGPCSFLCPAGYVSLAIVPSLAVRASGTDPVFALPC